MGKTFYLKPKSGDYFMPEDVYPPILLTPAAPIAHKKLRNVVDLLSNPPPHMTKHQETLWLKQISQIAAGQGSSLGPPPPINRPKKSVAYPAASQKALQAASSQKLVDSSENGHEGGEVVSPYLRFFLCPDLKRATGNPALVWTVKVMTEKGGKVTRNYKEFHMIVCWYQFFIGALGGIAVGLETNFFGAARLAPPNIPLPENMNVLRSVTNFLVKTSSSAYRLSKRALIAGYCFDVIDKNVEEYREKQDWKNMGLSGGITGAVFGLRGGFRGSVTGSLLFAGFGSLAGYQYYRIKQGGKSKPGS